MAVTKYIERIQYIDQLIRLRCTGSPSELAKKIGLSERSLYLHLNEMKEMGAPVKYSFSLNSYVYAEAGHFRIQFDKFE